MKVLLTGAGGQLGYEVVRSKPPRDHQLFALSREALDITDRVAVERVLASTRAELVINAAAYTAVDRAENDRENAQLCNCLGAEMLAQGCADHGIPLLQVSTDFVFDGNKHDPWLETDPVAPLSVYGRSKAEGEARVRDVLPWHLILRVSWVFGAHGHNFVKSILKLARERERLSVVDDQLGCPTWAGHVAEVIWSLTSCLAEGEKQPWGTYHYCDCPPTTWYGLATEIVDMARTRTSLMSRELVAIGTQDYPTAAARPANSVFSCDLIRERFGIEQQSWRDGLARTLDELLDVNTVTGGLDAAEAARV